MAKRPVDAQVSFPELEEQVLARWRERDVFAESLRRREGAEPWVFWEGPPTANGPPGVHHVLSRAFKDIFPRYRTMRGRYVERRGGWDCHGLPVEIAVEKQLGITSKEEIEQYGIAEFNQKCRESVFAFLEDWNALTERIGFWLDLDNAYRTLDSTYVESVWWSLKQIADKGMLYEGHKVVPYCPRCGTALSSHEVALGYQDVEDPVGLRALQGQARRRPAAGRRRAADLDDDAVDARLQRRRRRRPRARLRAREDRHARRAGRARRGARREGPRRPRQRADPRALPGRRDRRRRATSRRSATSAPTPTASAATRSCSADFVTADDGTGLVHTAIAFGEDDFRLGQQYGLNVVNPVRLDGTYDERIGRYAGRFVKDADADLVADLEARGRLLRAERYEHSYPHCWRCSTPLLYYAKPSWYIATSRIRDELLAANEQIDWHPEHIKHGRFGRWLENNVDWALSRERYWGTPLPVWRCENDHVTVIGSFDELEQRSGVRLEDPTARSATTVTFACDECGETATRVPEVIDVWFDSGAMPFAQRHEPFAGELSHRGALPGRLHLRGARPDARLVLLAARRLDAAARPEVPYRNVVCLGLILDAEGQKMSKSKGNVVGPWEVIDRFGADALRWYFFTSKQPWDGYLFSPEAIGEGVRLFLRQLWNTYRVATMYEPAAPDAGAAGGARPTSTAGSARA